MAAGMGGLAQVAVGGASVSVGVGVGLLLPSSRRWLRSSQAKTPRLGVRVRPSQAHALFGWVKSATNKRSSDSKAREAAKEQLREAVEGTERGVLTLENDDDRREAIVQCVEALEDFGRGSETTGADMLSATWRLLWTTEKETLFLLQRAGLFGTRAGESYQVIDVEAGTLNNVIEFPPSGAFVVDATIEVSGPQRITFKFEKARLKTDRFTLALPPFGKGWFDTVYLDNDLRIARDIRGDILVVERSKTPWQGV